MRRADYRPIISVIAVAALSISVPAAAQERPLPDLPLEELMRVGIKHVFGASERLQPVTEAPSSVTIVTRDEIARYGYTTLAEVLRSVRGFHVTEDRNYSYLGARGFSRPGDYNTRVLLLVNGLRVNDNVYEQASIGAEFGLDVAAIERVEIIRGPASSLYGTSAFFGVVNVVTRTGASVDGVAVQVETGTPANGLARIMAGRRLASGLDFVLSGAFERSAGVEELFFPAFDAPHTNGGIARNLDGGRFAQFYGQLSFGNVTVTGMAGNRHKDVPTASFDTIFNAQNPREHTSDQHAFVDARYDRAFGRTRVVVRAAYNRDGYHGTYPYESDLASLAVVTDGFLGTRMTLAARATRAIRGRQTVTFGGEFVDNLRQNQWLRDTHGEDVRIDRSSRQVAAFAQDEVKLGRWLLLNVGGRYDSYRSFNRFTPRGAVIVMPSASQSFKYLYGRAFRAPNEFELYYYPLVTDLEPEAIGTHELVWERYVGDTWRLSASAYRYEATKLITLVDTGSADEFYNNLGYVNERDPIDARGLELEGEMRTKRGIQAQASYVWQRAVARRTGTILTNSPRRIAAGRVSIPGPLDRSSISVDLRYLSGRHTLGGHVAPSHAIANLIVMAPLTRNLELVGSIKDLFDARVVDPSSDEHVQDTIQQNGRTFRAGLRWTIGRQ